MAFEEDTEKETLYAERFAAAVQAAGPMLPQVRPVTGDLMGSFSKLTLNSARTGIDGLRFVAPEADHPWDLYWEFVIPDDDSGGDWYILPLKGSMQGFQEFRYERNYRSEGVDLPEKNIRIRQRLAGGELKPGQTYLIWFSVKTGMPEDVHVRLRLFPAEQNTKDAP